MSDSKQEQNSSTATPFISKNVLFGSPQKSVNIDDVEGNNAGNEKETLFDVYGKEMDLLQVKNVQKQLTKIETLLKIFKTTAGKDKIAKLLKYFFELGALFASKLTSYRLLHVKKTVQDLLKVPQLSFDPSKAIFPNALSKIEKSKTLFFGATTFAECLANISKQMAFFRHTLRFGWTYFNAIEMYKNIFAKRNLKENFLQFKESDFLLGLELYYNVVDDLLYLHKLQIWDNAALKSELDKHDARSWYYQILYSLKTKYLEYCDVNDLILKKEIKRDMLLENKDNLITKYDDEFLLHELDELYKELDMVKLEIYILGCDFVADSIDVFNLRVPKGTYAIFSLMSGALGFKKLWLKNKNEEI